jgi:YVTN family beta-propeller protein
LVGASEITLPFGRPDVLHASDSRLWIAIHGAGTVFAVDPQTNKIAAQMGTENNPVCDFDVSLPGALWTAYCGRATGMARIDTQSKAVTATIPTNGAQALALAGGAGAVWAADTNDNVWRIDPVSNTVVAKIPVAAGPNAITVDYGSVWVASAGHGTLSRVSRIDPATNNVTATIAVGPSDPNNADANAGAESIVAGGGSVWVGNALDNKLYRVDLATNTASTIDIGSPVPRGGWGIMSLAYGDGSVWALAGICDIARIDPTSGAVTKHYTICDPATATGTNGMAFAFGSLWFAFPADNVVWRMQP